MHAIHAHINIMVPVNAASGGRSLKWSQGGVTVGALQLNGNFIIIHVLQLQRNPASSRVVSADRTPFLDFISFSFSL